MRAIDKDYRILESLRRVAPGATVDDAATLRRCERTLQRWAEEECGNSNDFCSWCICRDEVTGKPYREVHPHNGSASRRTKVADREAGALKRVREVCARLGVHFFHQGDPRGCALYVASEPIVDGNYTRGVAIC